MLVEMIATTAVNQVISVVNVVSLALLVAEVVLPVLVIALTVENQDISVGIVMNQGLEVADLVIAIAIIVESQAILGEIVQVKREVAEVEEEIAITATNLVTSQRSVQNIVRWLAKGAGVGLVIEVVIEAEVAAVIEAGREKGIAAVLQSGEESNNLKTRVVRAGKRDLEVIVEIIGEGMRIKVARLNITLL